jgi:hypothetical protein
MLFCTLLVVAFAIWQGCFVYDTSLLVPVDGATEASSADVGLTDADGCNHVKWPTRPLADDDASVQDVTFYNAIENLDFGGADGGTPGALGFDLDGVCTCPGPGSCTPFGDAGTQCDYEGGVDNTLGTLVKQFSGTGFFDDAYVNAIQRQVLAVNDGAIPLVIT